MSLWRETGERNMAEKIELYETFNEPNIVNHIEAKRLIWAGHLVNMNMDRTVKKYSTPNQME